jgi:hypothetical protein
VTPENKNIIVELWGIKSISVEDIARRIGCSKAYVSTTAVELGLSRRGHTKMTSLSPLAYARDAAAARRVTVKYLKKQILRAVLRDRLIDAVLDDDTPLVPTQLTKVYA